MSTEKKLDGYVDITPTWAGVIGIYIAFLENGNAAQKESARTEIRRMATIADAYNAMQRELSNKIGVLIDKDKAANPRSRGGK
jgi:hypothetical protein